MSYNIETFECNHQKFATQLRTEINTATDLITHLLINCGKHFSLSSKKWGSSWPESSSGTFATSK